MLTNTQAQSRFRLLSDDEIGYVSGGEGTIVVTGTRTTPTPIPDFGNILHQSAQQAAFAQTYANADGGNSDADRGFEPTDTDGDGVPDIEDSDPYDPNLGGTIVVQAQTIINVNSHPTNNPPPVTEISLFHVALNAANLGADIFAAIGTAGIEFLTRATIVAGEARQFSSDLTVIANLPPQQQVAIWQALGLVGVAPSNVYRVNDGGNHWHFDRELNQIEGNPSFQISWSPGRGPVIDFE